MRKKALGECPALAWGWILADWCRSFYYADERTEDGNAVGGSISGEAAAEEYPRIAEIEGQGPWMYTFVKGGGYRDFAKKV
jgi:hypothetical protein